MTAASGLRARGWGMGTCVADYDNDGFSGHLRHRVRPECALFATTATARSPTSRRGQAVGDPRWSTNCAFADYDRDGDLDLYVANYVALRREATVPKRGASSDLQVHGHRRDVRPAGPRRRSRTSSTATMATAPSPTSRARQASSIPATTASACCSPISMTTAGPTSSSRTTRFPTCCSGTTATARSRRLASLSGIALSGDGKAQAGMGVDAGGLRRRRPPRRLRRRISPRTTTPSTATAPRASSAT